MTYEFRFPMSKAQREDQILSLCCTVRNYMRVAPNQGGDETPRENIRSAFGAIRARLNRGMSLQSAIGELDYICFQMEDM